jgi:hypothetical protein
MADKIRRGNIHQLIIRGDVRDAPSTKDAMWWRLARRRSWTWWARLSAGGVSLDCSSSSAGFYTEYEAESRKSDERWYISVVDCHRRVDEDKLSAKEV